MVVTRIVLPFIDLFRYLSERYDVGVTLDMGLIQA